MRRGLFEAVAAIDEYAPDYGQLLDEIAALLQKVALRQAVPGLADDEVHPAETLAALGERDVRRGPAARIPDSRSWAGATWTLRPTRAADSK